MYKLSVQPIGVEIEVDGNTSLKQALQENGHFIRSTCGGQAACGECVIKILEGANHLNAPSFEELALLGNVFHITKERLSCQTFIHGDVSIDISEHLEESAVVRGKVVSPTRVRKKEEVGQMYEERQKKREEKLAKKEEQVKPWEVEKDPSREKRLGGNRRPKAFKYDSDKKE